MYIIDNFFNPAPVDKTNKTPMCIVYSKCLLALLLLFYLFREARHQHSAVLMETDTIVIVGGSDSSRKTGEIVKSK